MTKPLQAAGAAELERVLRTAAGAFGAAAARFVPAGGGAVVWSRSDARLPDVPTASAPVEGEAGAAGTLELFGARALSPDGLELLADFAALLALGLERARAHEAAARANRARDALLHQVVDHLPVVIYMADREGWFSISEGRGLAGLKDRPSAVGKNMYERYRDVPEVLEPLKRTLAGEPQRFMNEIQGVVYEDRTAPLRDERGEIVGLVGVSYDVTERVEAEAALRRAARRAEDANRMKSAFLANMSHEIRTPLTAILGFAELLADDVPPEHSDVPGLIMQGGHRLMETLNSVLDLARIEAEQMDLDLVPTDLAAEVGATVRLLRLLAERKGLRLGLRASPLPGPVLADRAALARVVNNLVGNAIKFTSEGGVLVEVGAEGDAAVLRVRDTGEGIAEEFLGHLFEPFRQETDGLRRRHEGSGLGLAITRRLVELMGGRIGVESRKGEGSTFTVGLPLAGSKPLQDRSLVRSKSSGAPR